MPCLLLGHKSFEGRDGRALHLCVPVASIVLSSQQMLYKLLLDPPDFYWSLLRIQNIIICYRFS